MKTVSKHTPGPWRVATVNGVTHVVGEHGGSIATTDYPKYAPLLAAAPDLLAALRMCDEYCDSRAMCEPLRRVVRAAIAKAVQS
jgi:hypothetical protein